MITLTLTCKDNIQIVLYYLVPHDVFIQVPSLALPMHISIQTVFVSYVPVCS
jgi:hypothetical protein